MTTVVEGMRFDTTEEIGEDGLTHLERKVLYQLVCQGEVKVQIGANEQYELVEGLKLQQSVGREIVAAMDKLIKVGRVKRLIDTKPAKGFEGRHEVRVTSSYYYRPVDAIGHGRPVLAWLYVYDQELVYEENRAPDGRLYKSKIAEAMGVIGISDDTLLADVELIKAAGQIPLFEEPNVPSKWPGGHGQPHELFVTRVTIGRIEA